MDIFTENNTELEQAKLTATDYGAKINHKLTPRTNLQKGHAIGLHVSYVRRTNY